MSYRLVFHYLCCTFYKSTHNKRTYIQIKNWGTLFTIISCRQSVFSRKVKQCALQFPINLLFNHVIWSSTVIKKYKDIQGLLKNNGTLYFSNKIKAIDAINFILSGTNINLMLHVFCKYDNDIQTNKATVRILVKEAKTIINLFILLAIH